MSHSEASQAVAAAEDEGRVPGTAAEERERLAAKHLAAACAFPEVTPGVLNVLFIHGFAMAGEWMLNNLWGIDNDIPGVPPEYAARSRAAWQGARLASVDFAYGEVPAAVRNCQEAVMSGAFHAVVVVDYSMAHGEFARALGAPLQEFARAGGPIAFTTSEGAKATTSLHSLFGTTWRSSGYYRTTWHAAAENDALVAATFPPPLGEPFSAKCTTLSGVPPHERCFGTTPDSVTASGVPFMSGTPVGSRTEPESVTAEPAVDYDVSIAVHAYGAGAIAYYGDVNCQPETVLRVAAFVASRRPAEPVAFAIDEDSSRRAEEHKTRGNALFKQGASDASQYAGAIAAYDEALAAFGPRAGAGDQRVEKAKILSNRAECELRTGAWAAAARSTTMALSLAPDHTKSRVRRARARAELGGAELEGATADVKALRSAGDVTARDLAPIIARIKAQRPKPSALRGAFGSGGLGFETATPPTPPTPPLHDLSDLAENFGALPPPPGPPMGASASWSVGLAGRARSEWFVDCYRMRVDDNYALSGDVTMGTLYDPDHRKIDLLRHFLVFCKLAVRRGAVPSAFDWAETLDVAAELVPYAFEKSDAKDKYGSENVFAGSMGGRSLRFTAIGIYGVGPTYGEAPQEGTQEENEEEMRNAVKASRDLLPPGALHDNEYFTDVGGIDIWRDFEDALNPQGEGGSEGYYSGSATDEEYFEEYESQY